MSIQVLVATMNQTDHSLLEKMNIQSDAIIANQYDKNEIENFKYNGYDIKYLSLSERGVGLNRNTALMRATSDICIIADDDLRYVDDYPSIVEKCFIENPDIDVIIFELNKKSKKRFSINKKQKITYLNFMKYGCARIAFKRKAITKNGISFNLHFGGGAEYGSGEDSLFLHECLKKKLRIIALPITIATLEEERPSTWFEGYTDKYFFDRGALFACISKRLAKILCLQFCIRHYKLFDKSWIEAYKIMVCGIKDFKNRL